MNQHQIAFQKTHNFLLTQGYTPAFIKGNPLNPINHEPLHVIYHHNSNSNIIHDHAITKHNLKYSQLNFSTTLGSGFISIKFPGLMTPPTTTTTQTPPTTP